MKKLTTDEFRLRSMKKHDNKYDYSLLPEKFLSNDKIIIICPIHGKFEQLSSNHLKGCGCKMCANEMMRFSKEQFIEKSIKIHGDRYIYDKVNYINNDENVIIICKKHGEFVQNAQYHMNGRGCNKCDREINNLKNTTTKEQFTEKSIKTHGDKYNYSLVEYKNANTKVKIICPIHGIFYQYPFSHYEYGCQKCSKDNSRKNNNDYILEANKVHDNKYEYPNIEKEYKNNKSLITINCPKHGSFKQQALLHKQGNGCPICNASKGELKIRKFLKENNIIFESQKKFETCRYKRKLPFDFYLPDYNICIEYDGILHFMPTYGESSLKMVKIRDNIKTKFCMNNNIKLIRIGYKENLYEKLNEIKSSILL